MSFDGAEGGLSLGRLLGLLKGVGSLDPDPDADPISQAFAAIAQRARLPKAGGLFGGDYARFMADNAPPSPFPNTPGAVGVADPTSRPTLAAGGANGGQAASGQVDPGAGPVAGFGVRSAAAVSPLVNPDTGQPYKDAKGATFDGMIDRGEIDPSAQPGSRTLPHGMWDGGVAPIPGDGSVGLDGRLTRAPGATAPAMQAVAGYHSARRGEGLSTVYVRPDGTEDVYAGGTMAWRNNNPGNLKDGDFARRHGAIGAYTNDNGTFAVFPDEATGTAALRDLLNVPKYRRMTVDAVIKSYAPPNQNNTAAYQAMVRDAVGVDGTTRLDALSADQLDRLVATIRKKEGAKAGTISSRSRDRR